MADIASILTLLRELPDILTGITVTKYLTVAGLVVLLYDHLLTLEEEVDLIWGARWGWLKILFFFNRYTVPAYIGVCCYVLSGITTAGLSTELCQDWIAAVTFLCVLSLGIANIFVVQRVWALWSGSKAILITCSIALIITYAATFVATGFAVHIALPDVSYMPLLQSCVISKRQPFYILAYAIPIVFETFIFSLICWNALMRPRYAHNKLVQQLYIDGIVYFLALTGLRVFNIIVISAAPLQYILLGAFFIWAMITATINRMLITISNNAGVLPASSHPTQQQGTTVLEEVDNDLETPLVEMKPIRKGPISPVPTDKTYVVSPTLYSKDGTPNPYAKVTVSPFQEETPLPPDPSPMTTPLYSGKYTGSQYAGFSSQPNSPPSVYNSPYQGRSPAGPSSWKGDFPGVSSGLSPNHPYSPSSYTNGAPYSSSHSSRSAPLSTPGRPQHAEQVSMPRPSNNPVTTPLNQQYTQQVNMRGPSNNPIPAPSNFIDMRVSMERSRPLPAVPRGHRPKESTSDSQRTYL